MTPPPPGRQATDERRRALAPTLLDRLFPADQCDTDYGDLFLLSLHPSRRDPVWSLP